MRLFVAVWPSSDVVALLEGLDRPEHPAVRWTTVDQWHVTLRFLGEVPEADTPTLEGVLRRVGQAHPARRVEIGPRSTRLGRGVLVVPVAGLDDLATAVGEATSEIGRPVETRPFSGHLTLARGRGRRPVPAHLAGQAIAAAWTATELSLVRSDPQAAAHRYETIATAPLIT